VLLFRRKPDSVTREFDRRHLVYRAWTAPELIKRWWHAKRVWSYDVGSQRHVALGDGDYRRRLRVAFHGAVEKSSPTSASSGPGSRRRTRRKPWSLPAEGRAHMLTLSWSTRGGDRDTVIASGMEGNLQDALT
jgi:hypothetical protein